MTATDPRVGVSGPDNDFRHSMCTVLRAVHRATANLGLLSVAGTR